MFLKIHLAFLSPPPQGESEKCRVVGGQAQMGTGEDASTLLSKAAAEDLRPTVRRGVRRRNSGEFCRRGEERHQNVTYLP
jgi:hypothetical protein